MNYLEEVRRNGLVLQFVPDKDRAICLAAVRQDGSALQFVPNALRDREE